MCADKMENNRPPQRKTYQINACHIKLIKHCW